MFKRMLSRLSGGDKPPAPPPTVSSGGNGDTRYQHYGFAHRVLPRMAFHKPAAFVSLLASDESQPFLLDVWDDVGREAPEEPPIAPTGLRAEVRTHGDTRIALIVLPTPARVPEAFFVAIVVEPDNGPNNNENASACRYLTLEYGFTLPGDPPRTVFGAWTPDGTHHNRGDGPPPDLEAFYARVCEAV